MELAMTIIERVTGYRKTYYYFDDTEREWLHKSNEQYLRILQPKETLVY